VVPDFAYILENKEKVRAIILTHAHEDHIGALPYLLKELQVPVMELLDIGLRARAPGRTRLLEQAELIRIQPREVLNCGDMKIEFLRMTHSIADSLGLAVTTPAGVLILPAISSWTNPSDQDMTDYARLSHYGEQGVLAYSAIARTASARDHSIRKPRPALYRTSLPPLAGLK